MPTRYFDINQTAWTKVGKGPFLIETRQKHKVYIHFGAEAPAIDTKAFHSLYGADSFSYGGTDFCWARSDAQPASVVVTEGV